MLTPFGTTDRPVVNKGTGYFPDKVVGTLVYPQICLVMLFDFIPHCSVKEIPDTEGHREIVGIKFPNFTVTGLKYVGIRGNYALEL
jgi:hypothetical protein